MPPKYAIDHKMYSQALINVETSLGTEAFIALSADEREKQVALDYLAQILVEAYFAQVKRCKSDKLL